VDADEHLTAVGDGFGDFDDFELLRAAVLIDLNGLHGVLLLLRMN